MNKRHVTNIYKQQSVMTASPEELTLMLYNECIKDVKIAIEAIKEHNIEDAHNYIKKAQRIIIELRNTLDMNYQIASEMKALYDFIYQRLLHGNMKKDIQALTEALELIEEFRAAWYQVIKAIKEERSRHVV